MAFPLSHPLRIEASKSLFLHSPKKERCIDLKIEPPFPISVPEVTRRYESVEYERIMHILHWIFQKGKEKRNFREISKGQV